MDCGGGDFVRPVEIALIRSCTVELNEGAEDDALVVGPGILAVVDAVGCQAVVDGVIGVDHACVEEPGPLLLRGLDIGCAVCGGDAVCEMRRDGEEEFIGDGVDVGVGLRPVDAAVAVGWAAGGHLVEDADGGVEVGLFAGYVVGLDPLSVVS